MQNQRLSHWVNSKRYSQNFSAPVYPVHEPVCFPFQRRSQWRFDHFFLSSKAFRLYRLFWKDPGTWFLLFLIFCSAMCRAYSLQRQLQDNEITLIKVLPGCFEHLIHFPPRSSRIPCWEYLKCVGRANWRYLGACGSECISYRITHFYQMTGCW